MADVNGYEPGCAMVIQPGIGGAILPLLLGLGLGGGGVLVGLLPLLDRDADIVGAAIGGALMIASGGLCAWWALAVFRARLELYEWGFLRRTAFGTTRMPFADVQKVTLPMGSAIGVEPLGRASFHAGSRKVRLVYPLPMAQTKTAAEFGLARILPRMTEELLAKLKSGADARFGKLRATWDGIEAGGTKFAWADIERMNFSPEGLRVFPQNRPEATIVLPQSTPNLYLLIQLCRHRQADGAGPTSAHSAPPAYGTPGTGARVGGFPDVDAMLGAIVCGTSRSKALVGIALAFFLFAGLLALSLLWIPWWATLLLEVALAGWCIRQATRAGFAVYERGLKTPASTIRWDDADHFTYHVVDQYTNGAYTGRNVTLSVEGNGTKIGYSGIGAKHEGVCDAVLDRLVPVIVEKKWKEISAGGELKVDKLVIKRDRIAWKGEEIPFAQVVNSAPLKGFLHVWKRDKETSWAIVSMGAKDARLALIILDRMIKAREPQAASQRA